MVSSIESRRTLYDNLARSAPQYVAPLKECPELARLEYDTDRALIRINDMVKISAQSTAASAAVPSSTADNKSAAHAVRIEGGGEPSASQDRASVVSDAATANSKRPLKKRAAIGRTPSILKRKGESLDRDTTKAKRRQVAMQKAPAKKEKKLRWGDATVIGVGGGEQEMDMQGSQDRGSNTDDEIDEMMCKSFGRLMDSR
ncbi:hypothetical protein WOLCODRAFT_165555 [Wolfiporia cocos MD-104 SS10]|uniref:Uncharacterized protein n=1 Tax=Wolfiporia cocos (strain MD-104) TaxID=742152 RepID=A0A2H3JYE4_WOLCO|nr:hypothetical protein WOLCODRAFT_165555 [Wolfiporia cocos MD-104 SS10]